MIKAPNEARLKAYVSLARNGMDYTFFQNLTEMIDKASGDQKKKLEALREKLLDLVNDIDKQMEARYKQAEELVEKILAQEDVAKATQANLESFTQDAVDVVQTALRQASEKNDYARMGKLQKMLEILQAASAPPAEVAFIEKLLDAPDQAGIEKMLAENEKMVNDTFMETLNGLVAQVDNQAGQGNSEAKRLGPENGVDLQDSLEVFHEEEYGLITNMPPPESHNSPEKTEWDGEIRHPILFFPPNSPLPLGEGLGVRAYRKSKDVHD